MGKWVFQLYGGFRGKGNIIPGVGVGAFGSKYTTPIAMLNCFTVILSDS